MNTLAMRPKTLNVIGCGKVGQTLARLLAARGACEVQDLKGSSARQVQIAACFPGTPSASKARKRPWTRCGRCFTVQTTLKPLNHAAAVFSSNFTVVLQAIACEAWTAALVPQIQAALLRATADNVIQLGPAAITGPAARGDAEVVRVQGAEVQRWQPEAGGLYGELAQAA